MGTWKNRSHKRVNETGPGMSLAVQYLRLTFQCRVCSLFKEVRSHMPSATEKVKLKVLVIQTCVTLRLQAPQPARFLCTWNSPVKNTGVGCHFLLQEILPTQGSNPGLLHYRKIPYHLSQQGSFQLQNQNKKTEAIQYKLNKNGSFQKTLEKKKTGPVESAM